MAIAHIVWTGLAPDGEGIKYLPTWGLTPGAALAPITWVRVGSAVCRSAIVRPDPYFAPWVF